MTRKSQSSSAGSVACVEDMCAFTHLLYSPRQSLCSPGKHLAAETRDEGRLAREVFPSRRLAGGVVSRQRWQLDRGWPRTMGSSEATGTRDTTYDLISATYHALQGAETYQMYEQDAKQAGDGDAASFFHEAHQMQRQLADRAKVLLGQRMNKGDMAQGGMGQKKQGG